MKHQFSLVVHVTRPPKIAIEWVSSVSVQWERGARRSLRTAGMRDQNPHAPRPAQYQTFISWYHVTLIKDQPRYSRQAPSPFALPNHINPPSKCSITNPAHILFNAIGTSSVDGVEVFMVCEGLGRGGGEEEMSLVSMETEKYGSWWFM